MNTTTTLQQIHQHLPNLTTLTTTHNPATTPAPTNPDPRRAPLNLHPLSVRSDVERCLTAWMVAGGVPVPAPSSPEAVVAVLLDGGWGEVFEARFGDPWRADVEWCWGQVSSAVGEAMPVHPRCGLCGGRLVGHAVEGGEALPETRDGLMLWRWVSCPDCGATATLDAGLARLGQLQELTLPQWAEETGVKLRTLQDRASKRGLVKCGQVGRHPLYRRDDLAAISV